MEKGGDIYCQFIVMDVRCKEKGFEECGQCY